MLFFVLLIAYLPAILVVRYWYLETGSLWPGLIPYAIAFLITIIEKASADRRFFENSWLERPAIVGPLIGAVTLSVTIGHWLDSSFWGILAAVFFCGSAIYSYRTT